jgi:uncharacterized protein YbaR (Trm112 family)
MLPRDLLDLLVCPITHAPVVEDGDRLVSRDAATRFAYQVRNGIPAMLPSQAAALSPEEHAEVLRRCGVEPWTPKH